MMFDGKRLKLLEDKLGRTVAHIQVLWKTRFDAIEKTANRADTRLKMEVKSNNYKWRDLEQRINHLEHVNAEALKKYKLKNADQEKEAAKELEEKIED